MNPKLRPRPTPSGVSSDFRPPVPHHTHELVEAEGGDLRCAVPGCEFSLSSDPVRENSDGGGA